MVVGEIRPRAGVELMLNMRDMSRIERGQRRAASVTHPESDLEAWTEPLWPSPSHAEGECAWCGSTLPDTQLSHCPYNSGCQFAAWVGRGPKV